MMTRGMPWRAGERGRDRERQRGKAQQSAVFGSEHGKWPSKCLVLINITIFTTFRLS